MGLQGDLLEAMKTRAEVTHVLHTLDGQYISPGILLLYASAELGWSLPAHAFHILTQLSLGDYAATRFSGSEEALSLGQAPDSRGSAEEFGRYDRQYIEAKRQFTERIQTELDGKPFVEVLQGLIVLSEHQLQYLTASEIGEDVFPAY